MPPKKSIFRQPNAQHFQLVHRSQQDPLINDPEASQRVFKPMNRSNESEKKTEITLADLEKSVDQSAIRKNEGEAANYGITYDDSSYDYMSHLKTVGNGGFDSFLIAAPRGSGIARGMKSTGKGKGKAKEDDMFDLLPQDVLPSREQISVYEAQNRGEAIPRELQGLQPDMDPHLRQVLEALDDDAFVDDEGDEEGWFDELVHDGEREEEEEVPWEFREWGVDEGPAPVGELKEETWEDRFKAFKREQAALPDEVSDIDPEERSEMADTVGSLASNFDDMMVVGGKKRRGKRGPSDASGMSMSSSSMFRTQGLRDLDDRFDKVEMDYLYDEEEEEEEEYEDFPDDDTASVAASSFSVSSRFSLASHAAKAAGGPPEITRDDFEEIMDDFLENYEVVGRRMRPALGGTALTGTERFGVLRAAIDGEDDLRDENRRRILQIEQEDRENGKAREKVKKESKEKVEQPEAEKWDVQTILSTYTNTENHPGMIRSRNAAQMKARAERQAAAAAAAEVDGQEEGDATDSGSETERETPRVTVARPKGELAEEKKARKAAVKAERAARRAEKKSHTETFSTERKRQLASHKKLVLAVDLLNRPADVQARTHKLKKVVPEPNSFFMDVKCPGCFAITTVFSHASTVVQCQGCATALCQPTGGKAKLTEGCSFRRKN
ncbi:40S ribosomal protein S27 [Kwoniella mangroviensis CBS 10435]|uniref:40S ribosomal protein S27 n=1 Tax=Kwoniella mangroviensis CBS 10435 TaxID=1331196 RepID=A0A1B9J2G3_9TREE|nr:40S ribosomal protein S27 [Kwoniella mangroviensis CBS 10435]